MEQKQEEFIPYGKRLLVKRPKLEEQTAGGIVLPYNAGKEKYNEGIVVRAGADCKVVHVDDKVLFMPYAGMEVEIGSRMYVVLTEDDVMGKLSQIN